MPRAPSMSILVDVSTTPHIVIELELDQSDDYLSGRITCGDGSVVEFSGWLGLISTLDALVRPVEGSARALRANHPIPPAA
jgi:hypothetical protein